MKRCLFLPVLVLAALIVPAPAAAAQFVVTNLNDAGAGSLRDAINQSNANGMPDSITTATGGGGTINLQTPLPQIVQDVGCIAPPCLVIEGNEPITLDGSGIAAGTPFNAGLFITGPDVEVHNLTIVGFEDEGILISGPGAFNIYIEGCRIGFQSGSSSASLAVGDSGIAILGGAGGIRLENNIISGYSPNNNAESAGVRLQSAMGVAMSRNIIGLNDTGTALVGGSGFQMDYGILARGSADIIVGEDPAAPEVISGQGIAGISLENAGPLFLGTAHVGTDISGTIAIPNGTADPENGGGVIITNSMFPSMFGMFGRPSVISGNRNCQIRVSGGMGGGSIENVILGLAADGVSPLQFADGDFNVNGVCIENAAEGFGVGSGDPQIRNVIGGHVPPEGDCPPACGAGIYITGASRGIFAVNNDLGTSLLNTNRYGVLITGGAGMSEVGVPGLPNVIAHSRVAGVAVVGASSTAVRIGDNRLQRSGSAEICLAEDLDDCVSHGLEGGGLRANSGVAPPLFDAEAFFAASGSSEVQLTGRTSGAGVVQVYRVPTVPHPSGAGGTAEFLVEFGVEPDFTFDQPVPIFAGETCLTATFTDDVTGTSELAPNIRVAVTDTPDTRGADLCRPDLSTLCSFGFTLEDGVCVRDLSSCSQTGSGRLLLLLTLPVLGLRRRRIL